MEVDSGAAHEEKENGSAALLLSRDPSLESVTDSLTHSNEGE